MEATCLRAACPSNLLDKSLDRLRRIVGAADVTRGSGLDVASWPLLHSMLRDRPHHTSIPSKKLWRRSDDTHCNDGVGHLGKPGDISAHDVIAGMTVLVGGLDTAVVDVGHDLLQPGLRRVEIPGIPRGILLHLEGRGSHAARIGCLTRGENDIGILEGVHRLRGTGHIGTFGDGDHTIANEGVGSLSIELVLGRAGQGDVDGNIPNRSVGAESSRSASSGILANTGPFNLFNLLQQGDINALVVNDVPAGI